HQRKLEPAAVGCRRIRLRPLRARGGLPAAPTGTRGRVTLMRVTLMRAALAMVLLACAVPDALAQHSVSGTAFDDAGAPLTGSVRLIAGRPATGLPAQAPFSTLQ